MLDDRPSNGAPGATPSRPVRVTVISRIRFFREGLALLLERSGLSVYAALPPTLADLDRVMSDPPDVVLVDVSSSEGMAALRALAEYALQVPTVAAAVSECDAEITECLQAGATGYVPADAPGEDLVSILTSVARGELRCPPLIASALRRQLAALTAGSRGTHLSGGSVDVHLTEREAQIGRLLERGLSNKEIAQHLGIELSTVKSHMHNIFEKLHVGRRREAVTRLRDWRRGGPEAAARLL